MREAHKIILPCPSCGQQLRVPADRGELTLTCPVCRHRWHWDAPKLKMQLTDIPLVSGIIEGFRIYGTVTMRILTERTQFISNLERLDGDNLRLSLQYLEAGIVAGLLYLVPFFVLHNQSASKFIFVLHQITSIVVYTFFIYGSLRLLKVYKATFSNTITIMSFLSGLLFPLSFVYMTPVLIVTGPEIIFSGMDISWVQKVDQESPMFSIVMIGAYIFAALWLYLVLPWLSQTFLITKKRALAALSIGAVPSLLIVICILTPLFRTIEKALGNWLIAL
jgi:hypothetical protein